MIWLGFLDVLLSLLLLAQRIQLLITGSEVLSFNLGSISVGLALAKAELDRPALLYRATGNSLTRCVPLETSPCPSTIIAFLRP